MAGSVGGLAAQDSMGGSAQPGAVPVAVPVGGAPPVAEEMAR